MTAIGRTVPDNRDERHVLDAQKGRALQELERHGYVADPHLADLPRGSVYRHPVAPSLLVRDDGRVELLSSQPDMQPHRGYRPRANSIRWTRGLAFLTLLGAATFVSLLVIAMIVG